MEGTAPGFREMYPIGDCRHGHEQHAPPQQQQQHHQQHRHSQQTPNFSHQAAPCIGGYQDLVTSDGGHEGGGLGALLSDAIGKITPQVEVALDELLR